VLVDVDKIIVFDVWVCLVLYWFEVGDVIMISYDVVGWVVSVVDLKGMMIMMWDGIDVNGNVEWWGLFVVMIIIWVGVDGGSGMLDFIGVYDVGGVLVE